MEERESTYMQVVNKQIELLKKAREKIILKLREYDFKDLDVNNRSGLGKKSSNNDRRMYIWIETHYKGKEYDINLFKSEIDHRSGNCHSQVGRIMFTKGYCTNISAVTSPNRILQDSRGRYQSDKDKTVLIFNSQNWIDPLSYFKNKDKERLANKQWITVDDILGNTPIVDELIEAFIAFIKKESE